MTFLARLSAAVALIFFPAAPSLAQPCCHHHHSCNGCADCGSYAPMGRNAGRWGTPAVETLEGKVAEVVYLPGPSAGASMVELRLQAAAGKPQLVRLAPSGYLKDNRLLIREGDTVTIKGYAVSAMEGDLLVATQVQKGEKTLTLRDSFGRSNW